MSAPPARTVTRRIAIRLSEASARQLATAALADGRTVSGMAAKIITDHLRRATKAADKPHL